MFECRIASGDFRLSILKFNDRAFCTRPGRSFRAIAVSEGRYATTSIGPRLHGVVKGPSSSNAFSLFEERRPS